MTLQEAKEIKTKEVTKGSYKCFDDLLHTHSHKGWLLQVLDEASLLYAKDRWDEAVQRMKDLYGDEYRIEEPQFER